MCAFLFAGPRIRLPPGVYNAHGLTVCYRVVIEAEGSAGEVVLQGGGESPLFVVSERGELILNGLHLMGVVRTTTVVPFIHGVCVCGTVFAAC